MVVKATDAISPEIMAALQEAANQAAEGSREPEAMKNACAEMDRIREDIRRTHGTLDIGVPAVRELRDE